MYIQGHAISAYMVCGRSIIDYDFILRLYLCVYHTVVSSMIIVDAVLLTSTENKCFQKMNSRVHDQLTRITGKRTMAFGLYYTEVPQA